MASGLVFSLIGFYGRRAGVASPCFCEAAALLELGAGCNQNEILKPLIRTWRIHEIRFVCLCVFVYGSKQERECV